VPVPPDVAVREVPVPDVLVQLEVPDPAEPPAIDDFLDLPEERGVAKYVRDEDLVAVRMLDVEQGEAVGERRGDRLLEQDVVALLGYGPRVRVVGDVGGADEDDVTDTRRGEELLESSKGMLGRNPVAD